MVPVPSRFRADFMNLARAIDHTLLRPEATRADILRLCAEAVEAGFFSVCVNGSWVSDAVEALAGTGVLVASVAGFPLGAMDSRAKAFETRRAIEAGAGEIDVVMAVGRLKGGDHDFVAEELGGVIAAAGGVPVKVILETGLLTLEEKVAACRIAVAAGAAFVKTSTGFAAGGATVEDVRFLVRTVDGKCRVKASGGIRDAATALAMIDAGAARLGTSNGLAIVRGLAAGSGY